MIATEDVFNTPDSVINEFDKFIFKNLMSLVILKYLARLGTTEDESDDIMNKACPKFSNPQFYPIKSRVPVLDTLQHRVERDLASLEAEVQASNSHRNNNLTPPKEMP